MILAGWACEGAVRGWAEEKSKASSEGFWNSGRVLREKWNL